MEKCKCTRYQCSCEHKKFCGNYQVELLGRCRQELLNHLIQSNPKMLPSKKIRKLKSGFQLKLFCAYLPLSDGQSSFRNDKMTCFTARRCGQTALQMPIVEVSFESRIDLLYHLVQVEPGFITDSMCVVSFISNFQSSISNRLKIN